MKIIQIQAQIEYITEMSANKKVKGNKILLLASKVDNTRLKGTLQALAHVYHYRYGFNDEAYKRDYATAIADVHAAMKGMDDDETASIKAAIKLLEKNGYTVTKK